jgi:hypothetical protein
MMNNSTITGADMQRYNQGFKWFGPMEQCKDGEWCKVEDSEKKVAYWQDVTIEGLHNTRNAESKYYALNRYANTRYVVLLAIVFVQSAYIIWSLF